MKPCLPNRHLSKPNSLLSLLYLTPGLNLNRSDMIRLSLFFAALCLLALSAWGDSLAARTRLSRTNLLTYHDHHGAELPVKSKTDWLHRRAGILQSMQEIM